VAVAANVGHRDQIYIEVAGFEEEVVVVGKRSDWVNLFSNVCSPADLLIAGYW